MKDIKVFLKKKKEKKRQYGRDRYTNLTEDEKQNPVDYKKKLLQNDKIRLITITVCNF